MWQNISSVFLNIFVPSLLFMLIGSVVAIGIAYLFVRPKTKHWQLLIIAFALLGGALGVLLGASKSGSMGTVLPAILTFLTALLTYMFGKDNLVEWRPVIPLCIIALVITMFFGAFTGSNMRKGYLSREQMQKARMAYYEKVKLKVAYDWYKNKFENKTITERELYEFFIKLERFVLGKKKQK